MDYLCRYLDCEGNLKHERQAILIKVYCIVTVTKNRIITYYKIRTKRSKIIHQQKTN